MRRLIVLIAILSISTIAVLTYPSPSYAISASDFNPGRIIDDEVFFNSSTMTVDQIQSFLNSQVPTCNTNRPGFTGGTGTVYSPPWICLKDFYENPSAPYTVNFNYKNTDGSDAVGSRTFYQNNAYRYTSLTPIYTNGDFRQGYVLRGTIQTVNGVRPPGSISAAQIIFDAAKKYNINPQVILVTLQKEQGLITDTWPAAWEYQAAMGYGCPDTAPCSAGFAGFSRQVDRAAWQFRNYTNNPNSFNFRGGVTRFVAFNPSSSCGGSNVYIQNQATANLYNYTPYQPNAGALSGMSDSSPGSTVNCGAYGNRNFFWQFNKWFGSTFAIPKYSWSINSFDYSGGDNIMAPGQSETATLKVTNTGWQTWYSSGGNPVRLGTWEPPGSISSLNTSGWLSSNRLANMQESSVATGQTATFTFPVGVKGLGTYYQSLNLVAENDQWMKWPGFRPTLIGVGPYAWSLEKIEYGSGTGLMSPGSSQTITVTAKNTGSRAWSKTSGPTINLGTWHPDRKSRVSQTWPSPTRAATLSDDLVAPGQTSKFTFQVTMPSSGIYYERLNLVAEGQAWFNDTNLTLYLQGSSYRYQPVWTSISTGSTTFDKGQAFTMTIKAKNTGDYPWTSNTRLATYGPMNRGSNFYNSSSWISDNRLTGLIETQVNPGQDGTFSVQMKAPLRSGSFYEEFNLVAEGQAWFESRPIAFSFNVR